MFQQLNKLYSRKQKKQNVQINRLMKRMTNVIIQSFERMIKTTDAIFSDWHFMTKFTDEKLYRLAFFLRTFRGYTHCSSGRQTWCPSWRRILQRCVGEMPCLTLTLSDIVTVTLPVASNVRNSTTFCIDEKIYQQIIEIDCCLSCRLYIFGRNLSTRNLDSTR